MKKIFALLCAVLMVLTLAGCNTKEESQPKQKVFVPNIEKGEKVKDAIGRLAEEGLNTYVVYPKELLNNDGAVVVRLEPLPGVSVDPTKVTIEIYAEIVEAPTD